MLKIILFILGFILMVIGITSNILYINLLEFGYTFKEYIIYIIKLPEFYYIIFGFLLINIAIIKRGDIN